MGARGFARRLCGGCGRCALVASFPGVRVQSHAFDSVALRAVWCCVCCSVSAGPVRVGCFVPLLAAWRLVRVLPFLCCWSAHVGRPSVLECAFWGFLLLFALLHLRVTTGMPLLQRDAIGGAGVTAQTGNTRPRAAQEENKYMLHYNQPRQQTQTGCVTKRRDG